MSAPHQTIGLHSLPVELLYELELFALSDSLPLISHHFDDVYKQASPFFRAQYILGRVQDGKDLIVSEIYTRALRYPICDQQVLEVIHNKLQDTWQCKSFIQLPRRLFKNLKTPQAGWSTEDHPIPMLRYLYYTPHLPPVNTNSDEGYALTRAVHAKFTPLVEFLLEHNASPKCHDSLSVKVAIRQKNLEMVKTLVERRDHNTAGKKRKRRKLEDRLPLDSNMLKIAVMSNAQDIVEYLTREKKILPDLQTLKKMTF